MAQVITELDRGYRSPDHARFRSEFRLLWPDLKAALELALDREQISQVSRLTRSWVGLWMDGRAHEIDSLMRRAVDLAERLLPAERGAILLAGVGLAFNQGDYERAKSLISPLLAGGPLPDDDEELPGTLELYEGYLRAGDGDLAAAERHLARSARLFSSCGTGGRWIEAFTHNGLGSLLGLRGDLEGSGRELRLSGELGREYGNVAAQMQSAVFQAVMSLHLGKVDEASQLLCEAADIVGEYPFYEANAYCVEAAAAVALARGNAVEAARALGMGQALRDVVGARVWPLMTWQASIEASVRAVLDEDTYAKEVAGGREVDLLTLADVVRSLVSLESNS